MATEQRRLPVAVKVTRLVLIEDHVMVREGLRSLIDTEPDLDVVGEFSGLEEAKKANPRCDVIIADLGLPDGQGVEVVEELHKHFTDSQVLVVTMGHGFDELQAVMAAGARGYLLKEAAARELVEAIRRVAAGEDYLQPSLGAQLLKQVQLDSSPKEDMLSLLTEREREVLRLLGQGHTNVEVAEVLGVSARTIESHRAHIVEKLAIRQRADLIRAAVRAGLVDFARDDHKE